MTKTQAIREAKRAYDEAQREINKFKALLMQGGWSSNIEDVDQQLLSQDASLKNEINLWTIARDINASYIELIEEISSLE